jgi:hypothetical protein
MPSSRRCSTAGAAHLLMIDPSSSLFISLRVFAPSRELSHSRNGSLKIRPPELRVSHGFVMGGNHFVLRIPARSEITPYHGVYIQNSDYSLCFTSASYLAFCAQQKTSILP